MSVGDVFADGRYKALHKLGFVSGILVVLKILASFRSTKPKDEIEKLVISQKLDALIPSKVSEQALRRDGGEEVMTKTS